MGELINGKSIAQEIEKKTAERVILLKNKGITPKLAVILVGDDKPSQTYVNKKSEAAKKAGINFTLYEFPADIKTDELKKEIDKIQNNKKLTGLIVQLPLPEHINTEEVLNTIHPEIDVDCLTDINTEKLKAGSPFLIPPTPAAILAILDKLKINLKDKKITILGQGRLVGRPLAILLKNTGVSPTLCDEYTKNNEEKCRQADIIISAVGKKDLVKGDMIKSGAIVIDAGVAFIGDKMYGDVNVEEALEKASYATPTPGGVGAVTVAKLLENVIAIAEQKI